MPWTFGNCAAVGLLWSAAALGCAGDGSDGDATPPPSSAVAEAAPAPVATSARSSGGASTTRGAPTTAPQQERTSTTGVIADPDDDADGDGVLDPFCAQQDFGGGLVLQVHCDLDGLTSEVPAGVTLVDGSLMALRSSIHRSMDGISGNLIVSRDPAGARVFVIVFQSDALFETGSSTIGATESFDNVAALVDRTFPGSAIEVRGHTDGTGDAAANLALSEARAQQVQARLVELGVQASAVTAVGFGETRPVALDDSEAGRAFNRRVEVVIRPTSG